MQKKNIVSLLAKTAMMIALTLLLQFVAGSISGGNQLLVGSVVNFGLLLSVMLCGITGGIAVGLLTPLVGLAFGLLANPLFYPFVAGSNAILILLVWLVTRTFRTPRRRNLIAALSVGCIAKYLSMTLSAAILMPLFLQNAKQLAVLAQAWGILQLFTAIIGSILAFLVAYKMRNITLGDDHYLIQPPFRQAFCAKDAQHHKKRNEGNS